MIRYVWKEKRVNENERYGLERRGGRSEVDSKRREAVRVSEGSWSEEKAERERRSG